MKQESIARIILIISIIILFSTGVMTTTTGSLLPIFAFVVVLNIVPIAMGSRNQKILAFVVLFISAFLASWAFQGIKHEKHMRERAQKLSEEKQRAFDGGKEAGSFFIGRVSWSNLPYCIRGLRQTAHFS